MGMNRREFLQLLTAASVAGFHLNPRLSFAADQPANPYELPAFGNVSLLHYTDCHAQLSPIYYREPNVNLGIAGMLAKPPHLVGEHFLKHYKLEAKSLDAYAFTYLDFAEAAKQYGKVGGFAHLKTLVDQIRAQRKGALLLDGGDTWQGSWTSLKTKAQDMVDAQLALGVNVMTAHWEMTYGADRVKEIIEKDFAGKIDFVAQNVMSTDFEEPVFAPYVIKEINGVPVAILGQAFPYTPVANPKHLIPEWSFGIRDDRMQAMVDEARSKGAKVVVVLSHNGMDVDLKMASKVTGIDAIMGGHTHDGVYQPVVVDNASGKTLVTNAGSNGKFLGVLDLDVKEGKVVDYRYKLLPVFSNLLTPDPEMLKLIEKVREPFKKELAEELAVCDEVLYRRGNFNGTFDQLICNALMERLDAPIAFSPGFRWGTSLLPGQPITFEHVADQTAITYGTVTRNELTGEAIKGILEDVADNLFNPDPYYQQGGDMVRVGGLKFSFDPTAKMGERVSDLELAGSPLDMTKKYPVAGWASVQESVPDNKQIWDVVADYLRDKKTISKVELNTPKLKNVEGNPGLAV
ncbi:sulfur-oxidizing protein SoxB [Thiothrix eikelboomii]|uniref:Sulfur-oxidizing protein SoxB n=1 Tax=Thiothrix eikelboomii TaxID=92487 RepID=A0A1T4VU53_9GAMM|nr:thiosulfohydrolase SoxB [Thiothrix eikelboomii]SKA68493.1 sulfur-oxidizing protein SoxB [Thiothrix eikelboomii]